MTFVDQKKASPIKLNEQQKKAATALSQGLETGSDTDCMELICDLLLSLYAPMNTAPYCENIFLSPVVVFLALICKTSKGAYRSLKDILHEIAMMKTCIRVRFFGHLMGNLQKVVAEDRSHVNDDWIEYEISSHFIYFADLWLETSLFHSVQPTLHQTASVLLLQYTSGSVSSGQPRKWLQNLKNQLSSGWGTMFNMAVTQYTFLIFACSSRIKCRICG